MQASTACSAGPASLLGRSMTCTLLLMNMAHKHGEANTLLIINVFKFCSAQGGPRHLGPPSWTFGAMYPICIMWAIRAALSLHYDFAILLLAAM